LALPGQSESHVLPSHPIFSAKKPLLCVFTGYWLDSGARENNRVFQYLRR